jgi:hypothetical protein
MPDSRRDSRKIVIAPLTGCGRRTDTGAGPAARV